MTRITSLDRTAQAFRNLQAALKTHADIDLHLGKTKARSAAGEEPPGLREIVGGGPDDLPTWVGDAALPPEQQGLMVLGTPLGNAAYVQAALQSKREAHDALLDKITRVPDLQSAWLLLLLCGDAGQLLAARSPAPNYARVCPQA